MIAIILIAHRGETWFEAPSTTKKDSLPREKNKIARKLRVRFFFSSQSSQEQTNSRSYEGKKQSQYPSRRLVALASSSRIISWKENENNKNTLVFLHRNYYIYSLIDSDNPWFSRTFDILYKNSWYKKKERHRRTSRREKRRRKDRSSKDGAQNATTIRVLDSVQWSRAIQTSNDLNEYIYIYLAVSDITNFPIPLWTMARARKKYGAARSYPLLVEINSKQKED